MLLIFKRFSEYFTLIIDRENKLLKVNGEQTNYIEEEASWYMLFDKCENHKSKPREDNSECKECLKVAKRQDKEMKFLSDKDFAKVFENQMKIYGFNLVKWE